VKVVKDVKSESLYNFIKKKVFFEIPCFQRNYSWEKQQCEELYNDVYNSYINNNEHYLGNLLYYVERNDSSKYILIDGQQRLTTIFLMLCAMRDTFPNAPFSVDEDFLYENSEDGSYKIKLKQNFLDANNFEKIICGDIDNDFLKGKSKIIENYKYFKEKFEEFKINDVLKIYDAIKKLEIIYIELGVIDLKNIQIVFEKINSTGKPLSSADLIRNLLLSSNDINEQHRLYQKYWIILEKILREDSDISQFSRSYLILKKYKDIKNDDVYRQFKEYFYDNISIINAEKVLKEMVKYAKYYSLIKKYQLIQSVDEKNHEVERISINTYSSDDKKQEKNYKKLYWNLVMLNKLNTDQQYPFFLQLFNELFEERIVELNNILDMFVDLMIRYRVVGAYGGGGALSSAIYEIIKKIDKRKIKCNYNDIFFELSNSPTPGSAFPSDNEFKTILMSRVNDYAKILLYKLEYKTKNIPVDINDIQIEHLMPQKLDNGGWWLKHLGGTGNNYEEKAKEIHSTYLNCIGNLALISQGYNIDNSNKPWDIKVKNLKQVQFKYTNSCAKYKSWRKNNICSRNVMMAEKACQLITSPLERTRQYRTIKGEKYNIYNFAKIDEFEFSNKSPLSIIYIKKSIATLYWYDVIPNIFKINNDIRVEKVKRLVKNNYIHKRTKSYLEVGLSNDPILSENSEYLVNPKKVDINGYIFYVEGCLSSNLAIRYSKQILKYFKVEKKYSIEIGE